MELLTAAQMGAIERSAIESGEVTGLELMERAGRGVIEAIFEEWPEWDAGMKEGGAAPRPADSPRGISDKMKRRAVVLCGPGNNGGDGFVVARLLRERGWRVEVFLYGDVEKLPPDARVNYERWLKMGKVESLPIEPPALSQPALRLPDRFDVLIDAIFGTGLTRPFTGPISAFAEKAFRKFLTVPLVAVDIPSGLSADTGAVLECAFPADLTVTFHQKKLGHVLADGPQCCGRLVVKDIGLSDKPRPPARAVSMGEVPALSKAVAGVDRKNASSHKYTHGHAFIVSGLSGQTGAARLAARGALRVGAGLVTLGVPAEAQQEVAAQITAIMMQRVDGAIALKTALDDDRINALCLGPALGLARARPLVQSALSAKRATVLDADALTAFVDDPDALFEMTHENCVLTPHGGEFARLFPDIAAKLNAAPAKGASYSKVDATREAAKRAGCVVLFKGSDTVIASPDGRCSVNSAAYEREAPWLASAGSGDVLAGYITGLLARGFSPMAAAETGAWLHVECALKFGPGLIAEDLPEQLPAVFRYLEG